MKILHLATVATSHQHLLLPQLVALGEAGHDVVAVSAPGPEVTVLEQWGIRHRPLAGSTRGFDLRADIKAARSFVAIVRDERPDVVHTHNPKPGIYGRILARALRVDRVVNTVHGLYATPDDSLRRRLVVYGLEATAARFSHLELVQSIEDADLMRRRRLAPAKRVRHLGNGIELDRFVAPCPDAARAVRTELGIGPEETVVGSVGRLVAEKGFTELLAASEALDVPHTLLIIGPDDPDKSDAIPRSVIDAARARGVRFLGHRDDIDRVLAAMDIFVLASYREGVPRAAMEAAASGLPIIATDIRGCRQVVEDGVTGTLVARGKVGPLRTALGELIANRDLRERYGKAGRARALTEFDEQQAVDRLFAAYEEIGIPCQRDRSMVDLDAVSDRPVAPVDPVAASGQQVSESYV